MKKLNEQEMATYVAERIELVSDKKRAEFDSLSVEEQYKKIKSIEAAKRFAEKKKSDKVISTGVERVINFIKKINLTIADVDSIIDFCNSYKDEIVEQQVKSLDEQIAALTAKRDELMK